MHTDKRYYIISSPTVNQFKTNPDRHWSKQEMMYDYKAEQTKFLLVLP